MTLSWSGKRPSYKYLQFIVLQLLVFPFPFPPAKWFLKNITVFKNYFFNVEKIWKSYWTASGNTASPSSQWADGWTIHKVKEEVGGGQQEPCAVWSLALPPEGRAFTESAAGFSTWIPSPPINGTGLLRKAEPGLQGLRSQRWRWQRQPLQALLAVCALGSLPLLEKLGCPGKAQVPLPLHFRRPHRLEASLQSWPQVPKKAMIQDREAEQTGCVIQKRGYGQWDFRNKFNFGFPTFSDHKN